MSIASYIKGVFSKPTEISVEAVKFYKEEDNNSDYASLTVVINAPKKVINMLESTLKAKTYQILAEDAGFEFSKEVSDSSLQMNSNFTHTPMGKVRSVN